MPGRRTALRTFGPAALLPALLLGATLAPPATAAQAPAGPVIWDDGTWLLRNSFTSGTATDVFRYGRGEGEMPVMGDWDGDGRETVGVARWQPGASGRAGVAGATAVPDDLVWYLRDSNSAGESTVAPFSFGIVQFVAVDQLGTIPVVGDWNGDGVDTVGVVYYDPATNGPIRWELRNSNTAGPPDIVINYGRGRDIPVVGDWDGNGTDTPGVYRQPNSWLLRNSVTSGPADLSFGYGSSGTGIIELPVVGDWNLDGKDTPGVLRNDLASEPEGGFPVWLLRDSTTAGPADRVIRYGSNRYFLGLPIDFIPRLAYRS